MIAIRTIADDGNSVMFYLVWDGAGGKQVKGWSQVQASCLDWATP